MKKLILFFAVIAVYTVGCDPSSNVCQWWIKNRTEQILKLKHFTYQPHVPAYGTVIIPPGDSVILYRIGLEESWFDHYFRESASSYGNDVYWQLLSEKDEVLRTWKYSDTGLPDRRFFEESSWAFRSGPGRDTRVLIEYSWTFHILPEDIQPTTKGVLDI